MAKVAKPKKTKPNFHDYSLWGVEKYGYKLWINPPYLPINYEYVIDVENYRDGKFAGVGFLIPGKQNVYYFTKFPPTDYLKNKTLIGHVLRTDVQKLIKWGFDIDVNSIHYDTALIEHLQDSTKKKYGLKELVKTKFNITYPSYEQIVGDGDFDIVPVDVAANYNGMDLVATYELWKSQDKQLADSKIYKELIWPLGNVLNDMEELGLAVDVAHLHKIKEILNTRQYEVEEKLYKEIGRINLDSPKQLLPKINEKGLNPLWEGKPSTDKRGLAKLEKTSLVLNLLERSHIDTLNNTYVTAYLERQINGVMHPFISQTGTRTGRLAAYRPNTMQVPTRGEDARLVKQAYVARQGFKLVELDYSCGEPRILADKSHSKNLCAVFQSGKDFHGSTGTRMNISRDKAKILNLSTAYKATKWGIAHQLECTPQQAEAHLNNWWALWPDLALWEHLFIAEAKRNGFIHTLYGRKIHITGLDSDNPNARIYAERQVIENYAQGSLSELCELAMIKLHKEGLPIINQVHDSILFEFPENTIDEYIQKACNIMEHVIQLEVPVKVDVKIGVNWGCMEKIKI